jgi:hypothetical protein
MVRRWIFIERCVACGSQLDKTGRAFDVTDHWSITKDRFHVTRCNTCKTRLLNPRPAPEEMARFYQDDFLYTLMPQRTFFDFARGANLQVTGEHHFFFGRRQTLSHFQRSRGSIHCCNQQT